MESTHIRIDLEARDIVNDFCDDYRRKYKKRLTQSDAIKMKFADNSLRSDTAKQILTELLKNYEQICQFTEFQNNRKYIGSEELINNHNELTTKLLTL